MDDGNQTAQKVSQNLEDFAGQSDQNSQPAMETSSPVSDNKPSASNVLSQLATEDFSKVKKALKFVAEGYKLDNAAMQELLYTLKTKYEMDYQDLLAVYLTLDIAVEKGALTNEVLDYLKDHPEELRVFES